MREGIKRNHFSKRVYLHLGPGGDDVSSWKFIFLKQGPYFTIALLVGTYLATLASRVVSKARIQIPADSCVFSH